MAYVFHNRLDLQSARFRDVNPDPEGYAVYTRLSTGTKVILLPSLARTVVTELMPGVAVTRVRYQDFMVDARDLVETDATLFLPELGDEIRRNNAEVYRVIALSSNQPYEHNTSTKIRIRIHTEYVRLDGDPPVVGFVLVDGVGNILVDGSQGPV